MRILQLNNMLIFTYFEQCVYLHFDHMYDKLSNRWLTVFAQGVSLIFLVLYPYKIIIIMDAVAI